MNHRIWIVELFTLTSLLKKVYSLIIILAKKFYEKEKAKLCPFLPKAAQLIMNKILIGALVCFLSFGNYFIFGCPAGLHEELKNDLNMTEEGMKQTRVFVFDI